MREAVADEADPMEIALTRAEMKQPEMELVRLGN
jgi:hypothetical protein